MLWTDFFKLQQSDMTSWSVIQSPALLLHVILWITEVERFFMCLDFLFQTLDSDSPSLTIIALKNCTNLPFRTTIFNYTLYSIPVNVPSANDTKITQNLSLQRKAKTSLNWDIRWRLQFSSQSDHKVIIILFATIKPWF